jgi:hypothetical protein
LKSTEVESRCLTGESDLSVRLELPAGLLGELALGDKLEAQGFTYNGHHIDVDTGNCDGLRRYGWKPGEVIDRFWRFDCDAEAPGLHSYDLQVSTTKGPVAGRWYWHVLSVKKNW